MQRRPPYATNMKKFNSLPSPTPLKKLLFIVFLMLITSHIWGQSQPITTIPFTLEKNCIYIYCKVNEKDSIRFLFDTGASGSVINGRSLKKTGLKINGQSQNKGSNGTNTVDQSSNNTVSFGSLTRKAIVLTVIPYDTDIFDGVFGTDLMKGNIIEIDYNKNEIRFYRENDQHLDFSSYEKMKLKLVDNYPAVKCSFIANGVKYTGLFGLDSGADDVLTIAAPYAGTNQLAAKMKKIGGASFQGSDGSTYEMPIVLCPAIEFSGKFLYNIPISLSSSTEGIDATQRMAGFFGNNFLKRFNTIIDLKNELIYFKLNSHLYTTFH